MKFILDLWKRISNCKTIKKLRSGKNVELVIAAILAIVAVIAYFAISASGRKHSASSPTFTVESKMTDEELRLASILSRIEGIDDAGVYISYGEKNEIVGVVVVAKGADNAEKKVSVIRCVQVATGASVDKIQIFQMANGG